MKTFSLTITAIAALLLLGCGNGINSAPKTPPAPPPAASGVNFTCLSVDNDQICSGTLTDGIWESGPVSIPGTPLPLDYINIEVTNNSPIAVSIFVYSLITIAGCGDNPIAFDAVDMAPGASVAFTYQLWNRVCGALGPQRTEVFIYNATGFDPADYANPWTYPRTDPITNVPVKWENILP